MNETNETIAEFPDSLADSGTVSGQNLANDSIPGSADAQILGELENSLNALNGTLNAIQDTSIPTNVLNVANGAVLKAGLTDNYVVFQTQVQTYTFAYGELDLDGTVITGQANGGLVIHTDGGIHYSPLAVGSTVWVDGQHSMVYSDLGDYPALSAAPDSASISLLVVLIVLGLSWWLRDVFKFHLRPSPGRGRIRRSDYVRMD